MFRLRSVHPPSHAGFTLIELMIVIGLISILAAILLPSFQRARGQANLRACAENLRHIATAVSMYQNDNNGLLPRETEPTAGSYVYLHVKKSDPRLGRYLTKTPMCPLETKLSYSYIYFIYNTNGKISYYINCYATPSRHADMGCPLKYPRYAVGQPGLPNGLVLRP